MTNEEIRIKVAETLKWQGIHKRNSKLQKSENGTRLCGKHPNLDGMPMRDGWCNANEIPNYPFDLNACAEFEKTLTDREHFSFRKHLWDIVIKLGPEDTWDRQFVSADAKTRCIAYLKTKGILP